VTVAGLRVLKKYGTEIDRHDPVSRLRQQQGQCTLGATHIKNALASAMTGLPRDAQIQVELVVILIPNLDADPAIPDFLLIMTIE